MAHVVALPEEVLLSIVSSLVLWIATGALAAVWLTDVWITVFLTTLWSTLLARRVRCTTLAPHVVVGAIVQRRVAFVATEPIEMLPFTEAIVVVDCDSLSSISNFDLILMCWSRVQVTERALAQVSSGIEM